MSIYSFRFLEGIWHTTDPLPSYTVPAGHTGVLRCLDSFGPGSDAITACAINGNPSCLVGGPDSSGGANGHFQWQGYQVLFETDTVNINFNDGGTTYCLSGYLLINS